MGTTRAARAQATSEHRADLERLRRGAVMGLVVWPAFFLVDLYIVAFVQPGRVSVYALLRLLGLLVLLGATMRLHAKRGPSPAELNLIDAGVCVSLVALISVASMELGSIATPLSLGVVTVLIGRGALLAGPWKRGLPVLGAAALTYPLVLALLVLFVPSMRGQLDDPRHLAALGLEQIFVLGAAAVALYAGHHAWSVRRELEKARSFGRYQLTTRLGSGGMGVVWRARDQTLDRDVAVKVLAANPSLDAKLLARFEREARATAELKHPNTVRVFDYGTTPDGSLYYAMELLEGEDLGDILARGAMPPRRIARLVEQAACSLAEAHVRGLVHRDLKPANLFVTRMAGLGEFVKVLDFGLARLAAAAADPDEPTLTSVGMVVGTPTYMAPEVCMGLDADARADLYALGTLLFVGLVGRRPFEGDARDILRARVRAEAPLVSSLVHVTPALDALVAKALSRDPDQRFQNALEMAEALRACPLGAEPDLVASRQPRAPSPESASDTVIDEVAAR